jgi:molybdopterin/thiamine biosynthesis adenylyltransferase
VSPETQLQPERIRIEEEDRFSRFRLLGWWDQKRIEAAKVLVVGAGALGNEILKNLALLGFQQIVVVDLDRIEHSNLSRAVLYRASDVGKFKADVAAESVREILPSAVVTPLTGNIVHGIGLGLFAWADVVIAGLDNREARLWINRACWKLNRPWVDGAIEGVNGIARAFLPGQPPCYECTLGEVDWQILEKRLSCNLLTRAEMESGKVPTTPTIASIIGGIQVQEAVKLLHSLPTLRGEAFVFEGLNHTSYKVSYTTNADCMSHHTYERIVSLAQTSAQLTLHELWLRAQQDLGQGSVVEFSRDVIHKLVCPKCGAEELMFAAVGTVAYDRGRCAKCSEMRTVVTIHGYGGSEEYGSRSLSDVGLPLFDVFSARNDESEIAYLVAGDAPQVLGRLAARRATA